MFRTIGILAILFCVSSLKHPDEIDSLPGLNFPLNYRHYSGYLNATKEKFLFYWFIESQRSPSTDPVLLWMNGGPGCSSLDGFLQELGPLHVLSDGKTLNNNTFSWNREANVIFLEAPAGVGFSYSLDKKYKTDDDAVSYDNYVALQHFFEKFPQFKKNDFYITGESYAGVYIPTLAVRILKGSIMFNFKGYAIGNGFLDLVNLSNSVVFFAYHHGLIGPELWTKLEQHCCGGTALPATCNFARPRLFCMPYLYQVIETVHHSGINAYNLYADCVPSSEKNSRYLVDKRSFLKSFPGMLHKLGHTPSCLDSSHIRKYLSQSDVRKALHVPPSVQEWDVCSVEVEDNYKKLYNTVKPQILQLAKSGIRGIIYNGDVDTICDFLGDLWFVDNLGLKVLKNYDEWYYNDQVAGFVKYYDKLVFLTIKIILEATEI